jgi:hypothetical protein
MNRSMPISVRESALRSVLALAAPFALLACQRSVSAPAPPPSIAATSQPAPAASAAPTIDAGSPRAAPDGGSDAAPDAPVDAPADAPPEEPALRGPDGGALPQTHDLPSADSPLFQYRSRMLWRAIVKDDPSIAMPFFFPVLAYQQVKDIAKPERDWKYRLVAAFKRTIHDYHRRLGRDRDQCTFIGIEVPERRARWMKPGAEGNKLSYYRVLDSILRYRDAHGRKRELGITSFISWRGQWYVVHLHGFK